jgi:hypothetical protein
VLRRKWLDSHLYRKAAQPNAVPQQKVVSVERETDAGSKHPEIVASPIDHIPIEIIDSALEDDLARTDHG